MPSFNKQPKRHAKPNHLETESAEECPSTTSFDEDISSSEEGFNVVAKMSSKKSVEESRMKPSGKVSSVDLSPTRNRSIFCFRRTCYLIVAIAAVVGIGFGSFILLKEMGWLPTVGQHKDYQGTVTTSELSLHDTSGDGWIVYYSKVYVMTGYARRHSGGSNIITNICGTDGTDPYEAYHPQSLMKAVQAKFIGDLISDSAASGCNPADDPPPPPPFNSIDMVAMTEVSLHDTKNDCWIVYYHQVYDMSDYAKVHPGGRSIITDLCGADGTSMYALFHKESLLKSVKGSLIGDLL